MEGVQKEQEFQEVLKLFQMRYFGARQFEYDLLDFEIVWIMEP